MEPILEKIPESVKRRLAEDYLLKMLEKEKQVRNVEEKAAEETRRRKAQEQEGQSVSIKVDIHLSIYFKLNIFRKLLRR